MKRFDWRRLLCRVLLSAMVVAPISSCSSTTQISSGGTNQCINVVNHGVPVPGVPLRTRQCDPWQNQEWTFHDGVMTGVGGLCVDVSGGVAIVGAPINYVPCDGRPSQNWTPVDGTIVGIGGLCIDIDGGVPADGAPLVLATCNGSPSQRWALH